MRKASLSAVALLAAYTLPAAVPASTNYWPLSGSKPPLLLALPVGAANWYCRPGTSGAATNWTSATDLSTIWSRDVQPGDTIWLAGGTYAGGIDVTKGGDAGSYLYIKRATGADEACTNTGDWLPEYDDQVIIGPASYHTLRFDAVYGGGSYTYWDGRTNCGIKLSYLDAAAYNSAVCIARSGQPGGHNHVTFANVEMAGPYGGSTATPSYQIGPIHARGYSLSEADYPSYFTFTNCWMHDAVNAMGVLAKCHNFVFDHCKIYNNTSSGVEGHANLVIPEYCHDMTWRYCEFWNWSVEGWMCNWGVGTIYMYGNVFHHPCNHVGSAPMSPRIWEDGPDSPGPVYFFNNTIVHLNAGGYGGSVNVWTAPYGTGWASGSFSLNNIVWDSIYNGGSGPGTQGYNLSDDNDNLGYAGDVLTSTSPFQDLTLTNYQLSADAAAIDVGVDITTLLTNFGIHTFDVDGLGRTRGQGSGWDIGAYECGDTNPAPSYSSYALDWSGCGYPGLVETNTITVRNVGQGELEVTAALASSAVTNFVLPLTNFIAPAGGTNIPIVCYHGNPGTVTNAVIWYTNGTASATSTLSAVTWSLLGESFDAIDGYLTRDYTYTNAGYIFQTWDGRYLGGFDASSRAYYWFHLTNSGNYRLRCEYFSDDGSRNSIWLDIGAAGSGPTNGTYQVWDMPYTNAHNLTNYASWRGSADILTNELAQEFSPMVWSNLQAGVDYLLTVVAREPLCRLFHFDLVRDYYDPPPEDTAPQIIQQPQPIVIWSGSTNTFSVTATGSEPLWYQWFVEGEYPYSDQATNYNSYEWVTLGYDWGWYWVVVSNHVGSVTSAQFFVSQEIAPDIDWSGATGTNAVGATNTYRVWAFGSPVLLYQWCKNGEPIAGATDTAYALGPLTTNDSGSYMVIVTNDYGSVTSQVAVLTVAEPPYIILQPTNRTVYYYSNFQFRVMAGGFAPLRYQWRHNGTNLVDGVWAAWSNLGRGAWTGDAGTYDCVITNIAGAITSSPATLTVLTRWRPSVLRRMQMRD